ncbi:hypothetical protein E1B28_009354 [Marasmius oreades]|uniref:Uncharacterized protein n=1 Tax=Marasmius oreades TaxID=181124 RepID=A0A9P7USR1_9AGAR|nr:uncharacterized protein E1B28_009354 [Marasmius oreades]KAG7093062.1 hypothetical protein E1B28_009354 [Marasmius oreades]
MMACEEVFPSKDIKPVYTIEPVSSSKWAADDTEPMQIYVFPHAELFIRGKHGADVPRWRTDPENTILLSSLLVNDFYLNQFSYDVQMGRFVTFPGISPKAKSFLQTCHLRTTSTSNVYMTRHFRQCLKVHCFFGDIGAENDLDEIWARTSEWNEDIPPEDRDIIDVALRRWYGAA